MLELKGKRGQKTVEIAIGCSLLEHALKNKVDWGFQCTHGNCARCRSYIAKGLECLAEPTEAEKDRLDPEEIEAGYRLGCQAVVVKAGEIVAWNKTYF